MSNPSFSNIDLWLFELAEGNLSPSQIDKLELFLMQNPDLDVDRDIWEMSKVSAAPIVFPDQASLARKKPVRAYALVGTSLLLLLALVGCLGYFGTYFSGTSKNNNQLAANTSAQNQVDQREKESMKREIQKLKASIALLEGKVTQSHFTTSSNSVNHSNFNSTINDPSNSNAFVNSSDAYSQIGLNENGSSISNGANSLVTINTPVDPTNEILQSSLVTYEINHTALVIANTTNAFITTPEPEQVQLAEASINHLEVKEAEYLPTGNEDFTNSTFTPSQSSVGIQSSYQNSFKNRLSRFGRNVQRMMENPLALKNSRDPNFHLPGMSTQDINFGSVGTLIAPRVQTLSRLQWFGEGNEQFSNQVSIDAYSHSMRGGIGLQLNHSVYNHGGIQMGNAMITYSPKISVSRTVSVEPSFRFKMGNKLLSDANMGDVSQVEFDRGNVHDYYTDGSQPIGKSLWYKDLGVGLNVNTKWFFASAQFDNIFNHSDNIYSTDLKNPRRAGTQFVASIGTDWENRSKTMGISPYLVYQKNEKLSEAWLGANYHWNWFTVGGAVSSSLEPAASIGIKLPHFAISLNSDYTYSLMSDKKALSYQVSLRFLGKPNVFGKRLLNQ